MVRTQNQVAIIIFLSQALLSCNELEKRKSYYEDGTIKSIAEMKDGLMHGKHEFYYPSGKIQSKGNYRNGRANGLTEHFYENGKLKSKAYWLDGLQEGKGVAYFENGNLKFSGNFKRGKFVGVSEIFFEDGKLQERKIYDSLGNMTHIATFKPEGELKDSFVVPIVSTLRDTVLQGKDVLLKIKFPYKMKGNVSLRALKKDPSGNVFYEPEMYECTSCDSILYKTTLDKPGKYEISFLFKHFNIDSGDTLNVNNVRRDYTIFVRQSSKVRKS